MRAIVICMPQRQAQGERLSNALKYMGVDAVVMRAVDGGDEATLATLLPMLSLTARANLGNPRISHWQTNRPGAIGCYASHLQALKWASAQNEPAIILEEDMEWTRPDFADALRGVEKLLSSGVFDMISFGYSRSIGSKFPPGLVVRCVTPIRGTIGYAVSPKGARKLYDALSRSIEGHVDCMIGLVAMTTAQDDEPFRLGQTTVNYYSAPMEHSLIQHNNKTWLANTFKEDTMLASSFYEDPERYDLATGEKLGRAPVATDFSLQRTASGWKVDDRSNSVCYNVYRGYFFQPGCILGLIIGLSLLLLLFIILYSTSKRQ